MTLLCQQQQRQWISGFLSWLLADSCCCGGALQGSVQGKHAACALHRHLLVVSEAAFCLTLVVHAERRRGGPRSRGWLSLIACSCCLQASVGGHLPCWGGGGGERGWVSRPWG